MGVEFLTESFEVALVDSHSRRGRKLEIAYAVIHENGVFYCECPDFKRRARRARSQPLTDTECKHIREVIDTLTAIASGKLAPSCSHCRNSTDSPDLETCDACLRRSNLAALVEYCECGNLLLSGSTGLCEECSEKAMTVLMTQPVHTTCRALSEAI